jgi:hypothetical protein
VAWLVSEEREGWCGWPIGWLVWLLVFGELGARLVGGWRTSAACLRHSEQSPDGPVWTLAAWLARRCSDWSRPAGRPLVEAARYDVSSSCGHTDVSFSFSLSLCNEQERRRAKVRPAPGASLRNLAGPRAGQPNSAGNRRRRSP